MTTPIWLSVAIIACFAAAAWMVVWSRADSWARPAAVALFLLSIPLVVGAMAETLGRHKPISLAYAIGCAECLVLKAVMVQDEAIYLYMLDPTRSEPWPVVLPWSNETADKVQEAIDGAPEGREGEFMIRLDPSLDDNEPQFHSIPQPPALPPKQEPESGLRYERPQD